MAVARAAALAGLVAAVASALIEVCADRVVEEAVAVIAPALRVERAIVEAAAVIECA